MAKNVGPRSFKSKQPTRLPDDIELQIDRLSHDGRGIGHHQGRVVMVSNALPGETVQVKIDKANAKLWQGRAIRRTVDSDLRTTPACSVYGQCGGCQLQHLNHEQQLRTKEKTLAEHLQRNGLAVEALQPPLVSQPYGYRHRARFHVSKKGAIGFHAAQENRLIAVKTCPILQPELQSAYERVQQQAPVVGIQQFEMTVDDFGAIGLCVVKAAPKAQKSLETWATEQGWNVKIPLAYRAASRTVSALPGDFTQVNRAINLGMIEQAKSWLAPSKSDRLLDLFCGNGNLSLALFEDVDRILGVEVSQEAIEQANQASRDLPQVNYIAADLFTTDLQSHNAVTELVPTLVLLDPPRAGAERCSQWLSRLENATRILYISCDPATLARDLAHLTQDHWHLRKIGLIDMFPQTRHIETMALLEK